MENYVSFWTGMRKQKNSPLQSITWHMTSDCLTPRKKPDRAQRAIDELTATFKARDHRPLTLYFERDGDCHYFTADGTMTSRPAGFSSLMPLLATAGLDPTDPTTQRLAAETIAAIPMAWSGQTTLHFTGLEGAERSSSINGGDAAWLGTVQWGFWLVLWSAFAWRVMSARSRTRITGAYPAASAQVAPPAVILGSPGPGYPRAVEGPCLEVDER